MTLRNIKDYIGSATKEQLETIIEHAKLNLLALEQVDNKRAEAIKWWNNLTRVDRIVFALQCDKILKTEDRSIDSLTGREIQSIWESQQPKVEESILYDPIEMRLFDIPTGSCIECFNGDTGSLSEIAGYDVYLEGIPYKIHHINIKSFRKNN